MHHTEPAYVRSVTTMGAGIPGLTAGVIDTISYPEFAMATTMYDVTIPVFKRALNNFSNVLQKGQAHAQSKGAAPDTLLQQRLVFDMLPLVKQVQLACDTAARSAARLAGVEAKAFPDTETTIDQARDRIAHTIAYLDTFKPEQINTAEGRDIKRPTRGGEMHYKGLAYVTEYALPNFYFHCTTGYDILRIAGTPIGKSDYLG